MTLRSPVLAMLWEIWRMTRVEAAWKLALGIVGAWPHWWCSRVRMAPRRAARDGGAVIALMFIVVLNIMGWLSIPKLNGWRPAFRLISSTPARFGRRSRRRPDGVPAPRRRLRCTSCRRFS